MSDDPSCLVLKLSGPMQAWPAHSRGIRRPSCEAPTYSAMSGLIRCAMGMGRVDPGDPLSGCRVALRVDRRGPGRWDYQSINPVPIPGRRFQRERESVANIEKMSKGPHHETVLTYREFLHDTVFICAIEGDRVTIRSLQSALERPVWQVFLGRKSCAPGPDLMLGVFSARIDWLLTRLPVVAPQEEASSVSVTVHYLYPVQDAVGAQALTWTDQPAGPVGAYYQTRQRYATWVEAPAVSNPAQQRAWVIDHADNDEGVAES